MVRATAVALVLALGAGASAAPAMPLPAKERADQIGRRVSFSAMCSRLGYVVAGGYMTPAHAVAMEDATVAELVAMGADASEARAEIKTAIDRNVGLALAELPQVTPGAKSFRAPVKALLGKLDLECLRLTADPIFAPYIQAMPEAARIAKRTDAEDALLEANGEASWQGPKAQVRGDLFYTVGLCRRFLSDDELVAYRSRLDSDGPRARTFYEGQWSEGIDSAARVGFDQAQCRRALASLATKAK